MPSEPDSGWTKSDGLRKTLPVKIWKARTRSARRRLRSSAKRLSRRSNGLGPLQLVYMSSKCRGVGFYCILWPHYGTVQRDKQHSAKDKSVKVWRAMKISGKAIYAASMQYTDEVEVVSRGSPRSLESATWGNRLLASGAGKDYISSAYKVGGFLASDIYCCLSCEDANNSN